MTFHDFFHDILKNPMTHVKQLSSGSRVKTIIHSTEINFEFWMRQLIFQLWTLLPFFHRKHADFSWLFMTNTYISGLSRPGKWNYEIPWLSRFPMTCVNSETDRQTDRVVAACLYKANAGHKLSIQTFFEKNNHEIIHCNQPVNMKLGGWFFGGSKVSVLRKEHFL